MYDMRLCNIPDCLCIHSSHMLWIHNCSTTCIIAQLCIYNRFIIISCDRQGCDFKCWFYIRLTYSSVVGTFIKYIQIVCKSIHVGWKWISLFITWLGGDRIKSAWGWNKPKLKPEPCNCLALAGQVGCQLQWCIVSVFEKNDKLPKWFV